MKITLVIPPFKISKRFGLPYPIGLGYVGTVLKNRGHNVKIIDCDAMGLGFKALFKAILDERPDMLGVTATSYSRFAAIKIVNMVKPALPKTYTAVGGPHFTATAEDALRVVKNIDFVVRGEGENTAIELVEALESSGDFRNIPGISFRAGGRIIHNPDRELIADLDSLPMIDRALINDGLYYEKMPHSDMECRSVLASRGCPFGCAFCFPHDRGYRRRSNSNILDEVEYLIDRYKVKAIRFFDLTFTLSQENVKDFCAQIKKRGLKFLWYCESRVDIDLGLLALMKEAGCYALDFGLESASKKVLNLINKKIAPEQAMAFAKKCKELGIKTRVFLMLSLPGEDRADAEETYNFTHKLLNYASALGIQVTQIIPGTEVERRAKSLGLLEKDFSWNSPYKSRKTRVVSGFDAMPLYMEGLSFKDILCFYRKYSIFDIYNIKKITFNSLGDKIWKGLTNWDKGPIFKLNWLVLFIRAGLAGQGYSRIKLPSQITWELTYRCNLACQMCFQGRQARAGELDTRSAAELINKLPRLCKKINLTGGEVFLREDIFEILKLLEERGLKVFIITNGTLLDEEKAESLVKFRNITGVQFSIDGPREIHDRIRGAAGAFEATCKAIKFINHRLRASISCVITRQNLEDLPGVLEAARDLNIRNVIYTFEYFNTARECEIARQVLGDGRALNVKIRDDGYLFDIADIDLKIRRLKRIARSYGIGVVIAPRIAQRHLTRYLSGASLEPLNPVCRDRAAARIDPYGNLIFCQSIRKSFGSLAERPFAEIWNSESCIDFKKNLLSRISSMPVCRRCCKLDTFRG